MPTLPEGWGPSHLLGGRWHILGQDGKEIIGPFDDGEYCIAQNDMWIPGAYDSMDTAVKAFDCENSFLAHLQHKANERAGGAGGVITEADLKI